MRCTMPHLHGAVPTNFGKHGASLTTKFGNRFVYQRTKRTKRSSCVDRNFFFPDADNLVYSAGRGQPEIGRLWTDLSGKRSIVLNMAL